MTLRSAVAFLKKVPDISRDTYVFDGGWVYAASPAILAAHPVPHMQGSFGLRASELDRVVARMGVEPTVAAGDGTLILRRGSLRSAIDLVEGVAPRLPDLEGRVALPEGLLGAITTVLPFVGVEGSWQKSVQIRNGEVRAMNSTSGVVVDVRGLTVEEPAVMTDDSAKYLVSLEAPVGWLEQPGSLSFFWASGAWARFQLSVLAWPDLADKILKLGEGETPVVITGEWREAFADVASLGEGSVVISPTSVVGASPTGKHAADFATGVTEESRWKITALAEVIKIAEAWSPDAKPSPFRGENLRGVIMKQSR
jgi:hypothetical protein